MQAELAFNTGQHKSQALPAALRSDAIAAWRGSQDKSFNEVCFRSDSCIRILASHEYEIVLHQVYSKLSGPEGPDLRAPAHAMFRGAELKPPAASGFTLVCCSAVSMASRLITGLVVADVHPDRFDSGLHGTVSGARAPHRGRSHTHPCGAPELTNSIAARRHS